MLLYEIKTVSDHIRIAAFPAAKEKGELCVFGGLIGLSDSKTAIGEPGSVDIGKMAAVFQAAKDDLDGTAAIAAQVYVTAAGELTTDDEDNTPFGTIVNIDTATFYFAVTG